MSKPPFVSVIIPVHTARGRLKLCLDALTASSFKAYEIIVVDDASTDDSAEIALRKGAFAFSLPHQSGPAAARNFGSSVDSLRSATDEMNFMTEAQRELNPLLRDFGRQFATVTARAKLLQLLV